MKVDKFKTFLAASGAIVLEPTNPYEVVRFKTVNGISVVYTGKRGFSFTGEAKEAYETMMAKNTWTITPSGLKEKQKALKSVMQRDGNECFYCGGETHEENRSLEHILSVSEGGNNSLSNLAIACVGCNVTVGNWPIIEKIKYRDRLRNAQ